MRYPGTMWLFGATLLSLRFSTATLCAQCVLEVPAIDRVQHVAVTLPAGKAFDTDAAWMLVDERSADRHIPVQLMHAKNKDGTVNTARFELLASLPAADRGGEPVRYRLEKGLTTERSTAKFAREFKNPFAFVDTPTTRKLLDVYSDGRPSAPVLQYNFGTITDTRIPESDARRSRSCYIHPVWGMNGEVISDDFPKDHFHHHGIFWTWPYVRVGDKTYDLWLSSGIKQQFVKWQTKTSGPVAGVLGVENGWFVGDQRVATERVWIRAFRPEANCRSIDMTIVIQAAERAVTLQGRQKKSYGGLTFRFDVSPRKDAAVRVAGQTPVPNKSGIDSVPDLLNTPLPWADLSSKFPGAEQRSGAALFVPPGHPDYPPTWLTRRYGALCVGWPGIKPYTIPARGCVTLEYRVWIHRAEPSTEEIEAAYRAYRDSLAARCR